MKKDALKKHHFWILVGLIPLLVLIAVVVITSEVGAAIEAKQKQIADTKKELASKQSPKTKALLDELDAQRAQLEKKRTALWQENWERQIGIETRQVGNKTERVQNPEKNLLRWPASPRLAVFAYTPDYATDPNQKKFGDKIIRQGDDVPNRNGEFDEFKKQEVYLAEFTSGQKTGMADRIAPTGFRNGWQSVLRHVTTAPLEADGWGTGALQPEQLWLALEDIWVQRALLGQIKLVNDQIGRFTRFPLRDANGQVIDQPLHRGFASRIWAVDLTLAPRQSDGRYVITGTITNLTDRLQLLGNNNALVLNLYLSADPNAPAVPFKIGGEYVPGRGSGKETMKIVQTEDHVLLPGIVPTELARVEQAFDTRTVPVRRVERLALGFRDSRYAQAKMFMPKFKAFEAAEAAAAAAAVPPAGGPGAAAGPGAVPPPGGPGFPGPGGFPGTGLPGATEGGGTVETVLDGNKKRYIEVTDQVRRMPVAISIIVDQAYMQDVLMAYANCPLRFQITQVHWQRFRGTLGLTTGGSTFNPERDFVVSGKGFEGAGFGQGEGGFRPLPGATPAVPNPAGVGGPGGSLTTVTESQLTSGLVELTIYGVVSLYEKYQPPGAADAATAAAPAPGTPAAVPPK
jgi:hypothetical protein